jgi:hypothetical protein
VPDVYRAVVRPVRADIGREGCIEGLKMDAKDFPDSDDLGSITEQESVERRFAVAIVMRVTARELFEKISAAIAEKSLQSASCERGTSQIYDDVDFFGIREGDYFAAKHRPQAEFLCKPNF